MEPWTSAVGAGFVRDGTPADAVDGMVPAAVVHPGSVEEVQRVVCAGRPLVASGLGAHLDVGAPPRALDVLLRLDRLDRVTAHEAGDMTVTADAGCPLSTIACALAEAGQWLPLDPPRPATTTVGGLVAANLSGPLRASQGTVRDLLLGLRVVDAGGALISSGGRVVKNVAGYDLPKMHVGALGTLGVVVEATFKVRPRPATEMAVVIACRHAAEAGDTALAVRERLDPFWLEAAGAGGLGEGPGDGAAVAVGLAGIEAEVSEATERVHGVAARLGLRATTVAAGAALRARLGGFDVAPAAAVLRAAALPTEVGAVMSAAEAAARVLGAAVRCLAHAASGLVRIAVAREEAVGPLLAALRPGREAAGGSLVVGRAGAAVKRRLDVWGDPDGGAALAARLATAFDPEGILAPGRVVHATAARAAAT